MSTNYYVMKNIFRATLQHEIAPSDFKLALTITRKRTRDLVRGILSKHEEPCCSSSARVSEEDVLRNAE